MRPAEARTGDVDNVVFLHLTAKQFKTFLEFRGDRASPRIFFSNESLELMSPSRSHEMIKELLGRLLEAWARVAEVELVSLGSLTLRAAGHKHAVEPDKSYLVGTDIGEIPHLAIEIAWTHGAEHRLPVYAALGVPEVWIWQADRLEIRSLKRGRYLVRSASAALPELDLKLLGAFLAEWQHSKGLVRRYELALRAH